MAFHRLACATAGAVVALGLAAQPAWAQLDVQIDTDPVTNALPVTLCTLGAPCAATPLAFTVEGVNAIYIYREGIIGWGQPLSGSLAGGLGSVVGDYFAPAFGAPVAFAEVQHMVTGYPAGTTGVSWVNFITDTDLDDETNIVGWVQFNLLNRSVDFFLPPEDDMPEDDPPAGEYTGDNRVQLTYRYGTGLCGLFPENCGFDEDTQAGYRLGGAGATFAVGQIPNFGLTLGLGAGGPAAVPEPTTWALMIAGFGLAGGALRRRRALAPT